MFAHSTDRVAGALLNGYVYGVRLTPNENSRPGRKFSNAWLNFGLGVPDKRSVARYRSANQPATTCRISSRDVCRRENADDRHRCGLGGRVHPQIAWAKLRALRDGAAIATKKLWS
jgi:hypothetical protein